MSQTSGLGCYTIYSLHGLFLLTFVLDAWEHGPKSHS